jgi:hypothetical protein
VAVNEIRLFSTCPPHNDDAVNEVVAIVNVYCGFEGVFVSGGSFLVSPFLVVLQNDFRAIGLLVGRRTFLIGLAGLPATHQQNS